MAPASSLSADSPQNGGPHSAHQNGLPWNGHSSEAPQNGRPQVEVGLKDIARRAARDAERAALLEVLERVRWNRTEAARVLKVSYKTLLSKLAECGIPPARSKGDVSPT